MFHGVFTMFSLLHLNCYQRFQLGIKIMFQGGFITFKIPLIQKGFHNDYTLSLKTKYSFRHEITFHGVFTMFTVNVVADFSRINVTHFYSLLHWLHMKLALDVGTVCQEGLSKYIFIDFKIWIILVGLKLMKPTFDVGAVRKECWSSPLVAFPGSTDQWGETIVVTVLDLRSLSERNYEYISNNCGYSENRHRWWPFLPRICWLT